VPLLTPTQLRDLTGQVGFVRYLRDLPALKAQFAKIGPQGWAAMVQGSAPPDPHHDEAWAMFLRPYDLPEFRAPQLHSAAARDLAAADLAGRVPRWVLSLLEPEELKHIEEVKKQ